MAANLHLLERRYNWLCKFDDLDLDQIVELPRDKDEKTGQRGTHTIYAATNIDFFNIHLNPKQDERFVAQELQHQETGLQDLDSDSDEERRKQFRSPRRRPPRTPATRTPATPTAFDSDSEGEGETIQLKLPPRWPKKDTANDYASADELDVAVTRGPTTTRRGLRSPTPGEQVEGYVVEGCDMDALGGTSAPGMRRRFSAPGSPSNGRHKHRRRNTGSGGGGARTWGEQLAIAKKIKAGDAEAAAEAIGGLEPVAPQRLYRLSCQKWRDFWFLVNATLVDPTMKQHGSEGLAIGEGLCPRRPDLTVIVSAEKNAINAQKRQVWEDFIVGVSLSAGNSMMSPSKPRKPDHRRVRSLTISPFKIRDFDEARMFGASDAVGSLTLTWRAVHKLPSKLQAVSRWLEAGPRNHCFTLKSMGTPQKDSAVGNAIAEGLRDAELAGSSLRWLLLQNHRIEAPVQCRVAESAANVVANMKMTVDLPGGIVLWNRFKKRSPTHSIAQLMKNSTSLLRLWVHMRSPSNSYDHLEKCATALNSGISNNKGLLHLEISADESVRMPTRIFQNALERNLTIIKFVDNVTSKTALSPQEFIFLKRNQDGLRSAAQAAVDDFLADSKISFHKGQPVDSGDFDDRPESLSDIVFEYL